jgi:hypothetical protein
MIIALLLSLLASDHYQHFNISAISYVVVADAAGDRKT